MAQMPPLFPEPDAVMPATFVEYWLGFTDVDLIAKLLLALLLACLLAAVIAYHPRSVGKVTRLVDLESPKTFIMYSMVGAVIGTIVLRYPYTALVIFGIGGLLRFRTDVGQAKDTGQAILVTLIGLCCGLELPHVAVFATAFAFVLIFVLEGGAAFRIVVRGLTRETVPAAAAAYRALLEEQGCAVLSEKKNFVKKQTSFVFRAPRRVTREDLENVFEERVADDLRGAVDWEAG
jgi:hypothetical protein